MIIQIVKLESALSEEEVMSIAKERANQFREVPGLIQKYYVKLGDPNQYGGFYVWDSKESMQAFRETELAATIPIAYKVKTPPTIEIYETLFQLRE